MVAGDIISVNFHHTPTTLTPAVIEQTLTIVHQQQRLNGVYIPHLLHTQAHAAANLPLINLQPTMASVPLVTFPVTWHHYS